MSRTTLGVRLEPQPMQREPLGDRVRDRAHAVGGHQNVEGLHGVRPFRFRARAGRGTCRHHGEPRRHVSSRPGARCAAPHAPGFPLLSGARSCDRRPSRRPMRREWRRQDQSPRGVVAAVARPGPAPRGARRMRAASSGARRVRPVGRGRGGRRDPSARLRLEPGATAAAERRNRIDRAPVASSRAFCDHVRIVWLTPAMDSLFSGPASERRRFLDRFVLAIDPGHGARVDAVRAGVARAQPAPRRRRGGTPPGSTRSSGRRPSSASPSPPRGSNA